MKNLTLSLGRLAVVLASALSLGACSRANYATTPAASNPLGASAASSPQVATPYVPVAAEASAVVKAAPGSLAPTAVTPATPDAAPATAATVAAPVVAPVTKPAAKPASKLNLTQRLAFHKLTKKLDKLTVQMPQLKKQDASAARGGLDSNLRSAILFGLVGLILLAFSGVNGVGGVFAVLGAISIIVGLVFLVLWLLDQA